MSWVEISDYTRCNDKQVKKLLIKVIFDNKKKKEREYLHYSKNSLSVINF